MEKTRGRRVDNRVASQPSHKKHGQEPGLCATCLHCTRVESSRGSTFFLCELSREKPEFPKYPRLPVLTCDGYTRSLSG